MNKWYNIDIDKDNLELLKVILKEKHIKYETSGITDFLQHLEIYCNEYEVNSINKIIDGLDDLTRLPF